MRLAPALLVLGFIVAVASSILVLDTARKLAAAAGVGPGSVGARSAARGSSSSSGGGGVLMPPSLRAPKSVANMV